MNFSKMLELKVGDLMILEASESSPLPVYVQGRRKMTGSPRVAGGSLAVMLDSGLSASPASPSQPFSAPVGHAR
jgi:flagellar motor switch protein FliM